MQLVFTSCRIRDNLRSKGKLKVQLTPFVADRASPEGKRRKKPRLVIMKAASGANTPGC